MTTSATLDDKDVLALLGGVFVTTYDFFAVNIALPLMGRQLGATAAQLQWIVAAYGLCLGSALLAASRLAEVMGPRRAFRFGALGFALTSAGAAMAPGAATLICWRAMQGLAAAVLMPQVLTLLVRQPDVARRQRAFAGYGVALGLGPAVGQLLAGWAVQVDPWQVGWRLVFGINAVLAFGIALLLSVPRESRRTHGRLDWVGVALLGAAMAALVWPLIEGRRLHGSPWLLAPLLSGALGLWGVWRRQGRAGAAGHLALIDVEALRRAPFRRALVTVLLFYSINGSFYLVLSMTLQAHFGLRPLTSAGVFSVLVAAFLGPTLLAQRLQARFGPQVMVVGAVLLCLSHAALALLLWRSCPLPLVIAGLIPTGFALGLVMAPLVGAAVMVGGGGSGASGLTGSAQWLGNAIGAAALGAVYFGWAGTDLAAAALAESLVHGLCAVVAVVVGVLLPGWIRAPTDTQAQPEGTAS